MKIGFFGFSLFSNSFSINKFNVRRNLSGGNGGLQSYNGYNNNNYNGQRNVGFGYYRGTDSNGFIPSRELNYYSGAGYRGYQ